MCLASPPRTITGSGPPFLVSDGGTSAGKTAPGFIHAGLLIFKAEVDFFKGALTLGSRSYFSGKPRFLLVFPQVELEGRFFNVRQDRFRRRGREFNLTQVAVDSHGGFLTVGHGFDHRTLPAGDIAAGDNP